jgi:class 3 adenylate cyclase
MGGVRRPEGVVTFLLCDVVGSTRAWESDVPLRVQQAVERMYALVDAAVTGAGGFRPAEQGEGDSVVAAFPLPSQALNAACAAQRALGVEEWPTRQPLLVRMAVHTGEAFLREERDYLGPAIIRTARLRALAHGGQVLVSGITRQLVGADLPTDVSLRDLGVHALKDLALPEHVFQLTHPELPAEFPALVSRRALRGDVPVELSPIIGREADIAALEDLLVRSRLVTLTGPGGAGKTRLAVQVAGDVAERLPGGGWFVDLASLAHGDLVDGAVAAVLGVVPGTAPRPALAARLADEEALLVVDNGEHVADAVADMVIELLGACPTLRVLVTSRVVLDVPGEIAWQLPPLELPGVDVDLDALATNPAVELFVVRAGEARTGFALHAGNAGAVVDIVRRLDGLPLAIELAAARVRSLTPARIAAGLDDSLAFLSSRSARRSERQRTLDASIGWSYQLLAEIERTVLRRLAVFSGPSRSTPPTSSSPTATSPALHSSTRSMGSSSTPCSRPSTMTASRDSR